VLAQGAGLQRVAAYALRHLSRIAQRRGQLVLAHERVRESLRLAREQGERYVILFDLGQLAGLAVGTGNAPRAARLKGAESALRERLDIPLPPVYRAEEEETLAEATAVLTAEAFSRAWGAGRAMGLDEAVAFALAES
jgi:non-specific serine/threonine protein kinase